MNIYRTFYGLRLGLWSLNLPHFTHICTKPRKKYVILVSRGTDWPITLNLVWAVIVNIPGAGTHLVKANAGWSEFQVNASKKLSRKFCSTMTKCAGCYIWENDLQLSTECWLYLRHSAQALKNNQNIRIHYLYLT